MQQQGRCRFGELYDLRAVRVLVDDVPAATRCSAWCMRCGLPVPDEFDDYIARPKAQRLPLAAHRGDRAGRARRWRCRSARTRCTRTPNSAWPRTGVQGRRPEPRADAAIERRSPGCGSCSRCARASDEAGLLRELDSELARGPHLRADAARRSHRPAAGRARRSTSRTTCTPKSGIAAAARRSTARIVPLDHVLRSGDRVEIMTAKSRRAAARLAGAVERLPRQRPRRAKRSALVPQARPRAQPAGRSRTAR